MPVEQKVPALKMSNPKSQLTMAMQTAVPATRQHNVKEHLLESEMLRIESPRHKVADAESKGSSMSLGDFRSAASKDEPLRPITPNRKGIVQRKQTGPTEDPDDDISCQMLADHISPDDKDKSSERADLPKQGSTFTFRRGTGFTSKADTESLTSKKGQSLMMRSRMRRLLDKRKHEFASWPSAEQARLRSAFQTGDPAGKAALDSKGLRLAFAALGLEGRTVQEKEAIAKIAREAAIRGSINFFDFVFQLVPEVEHKLEELRSPKLYAEFQLIDTHGAGRIKEHQCLVALEKHTKAVQSLQKDDETFQSFWKQFVKDFPGIYKARCQGVEQWLDFKGFQILATELDSQRAAFQQQLEKRIANQTCLPLQLEKMHAGELSALKRVFDAHEMTDHETLAVDRAVDGLLQCGVAAPVGPLWDRMQKAMSEFDGMAFAFKDFLMLVDGMREETNTLLKGALQSYVKQLGSTASITAHDIPAIMGELPVCKDCCNNSEDLISLVESCDKDCNDLDASSLVVVIAKVSERSRITQREIEATTAKQLGFSAKQVMQLRESFASLTRTGALGVEEVKLWFKEINPDMDPTTKQIEELIEEAAPALAPPIFKPQTARHRSGDSDRTDAEADDKDSAASSNESDSHEKDANSHITDAQAAGTIHSQRLHRMETVALAKIDADKAVKKAKDHHADRSSVLDSSLPSVGNQHSVAILGLDEEEEQDQSGLTKAGARRNVDLGISVDRDQRSSVMGSVGNVLPQTPGSKAQTYQESIGEEFTEQEKDRKEDGAAPPEISSGLSPVIGGNLLYFDGFMRLISMIMKA